MRTLIAFIIALTTATASWANDPKPGDFDYYVLALSWSPNWCALEGDARSSDQCETRYDYGWTLHGLWPQYDTGWPSFCRTNARQPSRSMTNDMTDIMGSSGLAWHQWKKHGTCSGLTASDYYALSREAYDRVTRPQVFRQLDKPVRLPAHVVEAAFLKENPDITKDGLTVTCRDGYIQEIRLCLSRDLTPMQCGDDVRKDCTLDRALFTPVR